MKHEYRKNMYSPTMSTFTVYGIITTLFLYGFYWLVNVYSVIQYIIGSLSSILKRMSYCHMTTHEQLVVKARIVLV